jgi:YVTN family beta-propeller protein
MPPASVATGIISNRLDHPDWLTFSPDGKSLYVANAGSNSVSVVDVAAQREVTQIPVGQVPKRNVTVVLP